MLNKIQSIVSLVIFWNLTSFFFIAFNLIGSESKQIFLISKSDGILNSLLT